MKVRVGIKVEIKVEASVARVSIGAIVVVEVIEARAKARVGTTIATLYIS